MQKQQLRYRAASFALLTTVLLTAGKIGAAFITGSVGVLSEGIHSALDLVSAAVAFFAIREAGKPADREHPFGHGKIETISSLLESQLLVVAAGYIVYEAIHHFLHPTELKHQDVAIAVIGVSLVISWFVYLHNKKVAQQTESSAIAINALHFLSDTIASAGVLIALLLIQWTGWLWIDPVVALLVAFYIFAISWKQVKKSIQELTDHRLPENEVAKIKSIIASFQPQVIEAHDLRTRKSGSERYIEFHLLLCGKMSVNESHTLCDSLEEKILKTYPSAQVTIHVEPCGEHKITPLKCAYTPNLQCERKTHR